MWTPNRPCLDAVWRPRTPATATRSTPAGRNPDPRHPRHPPAATPHPPPATRPPPAATPAPASRNRTPASRNSRHPPRDPNTPAPARRDLGSPNPNGSRSRPGQRPDREARADPPAHVCPHFAARLPAGATSGRIRARLGMLTTPLRKRPPPDRELWTPNARCGLAACQPPPDERRRP